MNIKEAKAHIKNAIIAYFEKNDINEYFIPVEKQRPIFLYGPPGIGKTAIMEQIAEEMGIGLVSYSMTHHTRQSAIGLPFITKKIYNGKEYDISEYTMSEILASVYEYIEASGKAEGILFLDEINCVSETLAPSMLRFLQYKTFGSHSVPDGWVVVTAGNPPEFNKSVREYDIATLDRIKKINVEPDYDVWREYAHNQNVHPAIIAYLDVKKSDFYIIENTPKGKSFVTARSWEDLSRMLWVFENKSIEIDISLIEQYIQSKTISEDFTDYYETFKKLTNIVSVKDILNGSWCEEHIAHLNNAGVSEKLGFINVLSNEICSFAKNAVNNNKSIKSIAEFIKDNSLISKTQEEAVDVLSNFISELNSADYNKSIYLKETHKQKEERLAIIDKLIKFKAVISSAIGDTKPFVTVFLNEEVNELKKQITDVQRKLTFTCEFLQKAFGNSPEIQIFVSNINTNRYTSLFLMSFGCNGFAQISENDFNETDIIEKLKDII